MRTPCYPTDLTDDQWAIIEPLLPKAKPGGRPRSTDLRAVIDACLYRTKAGCQWRMLPADFPPWSTVHTYYRAWRRDSTWQTLHDARGPRVRTKAGREPTPKTAYWIASRSRRPADVKGWVLLPKRGVVERTFAWRRRVPVAEPGVRAGHRQQ